MPRSRVPIRGSIGKSILTGQKQTVVQQTIVQQVAKSGTSGVGTVASTIWPLIQQIPVNVVDIAALATPGLVVDTGSHIIARTLAVNAPLTIADPTGAAGNPTISLTTAALTKTDDTNVTLSLGGTPASALVAAVSLTLGWTGQLAVSRGGTGNSALAALSKTDDTNVTLTLGGTPATALVNAASITVGWTGTLAVSRGGSGAGTLTGYLIGNGTSPFTASATIPTGDITGLATIATSGSASDLTTGTVPSAQLPTASTSVLGAVKVDGTTITISGGVISSTGGATGANPTASIGLTAVNGTATTFLRSDGAPALDQGIAPTWTGQHKFEGGLFRSGTVLSASVGLDGAVYPAVAWNCPSGFADSNIWEAYSTGTAWHLQIVNDAFSIGVDAITVARSGTSISSLTFGNVTDKPPITLNGAVTGLGPVSGVQIDMTPDASTFTGTLTGMTATITNTCVWSRNGNQVTLVIGAASGTSNATTFTMTGLPAAIQPARTQFAAMTSAAVFTNGGTNVQGNTLVTASSGTVTFGTVAGPWNNALSKGVAVAFTITYLLN